MQLSKNFYLQLFFRGLLWGIFFLGISVKAQDKSIRFERIASENIKVERGLSVNSVNCMLQDSRGFMWIGTWDGLNKYDGYKFKVYRSNYLDKDDELTNQTVQALCEDSDGLIWIGTEQGLTKYDSKNQKFSKYYSVKNQTSTLSNDTIWSVFQDSYGNLWVGTQNGLNLYDKKTQKFKRFFHDPQNTNSLNNNKINDIYEDNLGCIWIATNGGLNRYNLLNKTFTLFKYNSKEQGLPNDTVISVVQDKKGILWIGTQNGLCIYDIQNSVYKTYKNVKTKKNTISSNHIVDVFVDKSGIIWVATANAGLNKYEPTDDSFTCFQTQNNDQYSLSNDNLSCIYEDKSGILWIGSFKGVNKIDNTSSKFNHFKHIENDGFSLNNNMVWAFDQDKNGDLWIGTTDGLNKYDKTNGKFSIYKNNLRDPNTISSNNIRSVITDKQGNSWIGTLDAGLDMFVKKDKSNDFVKVNYKHSPTEKNSLSDNCVWCLLEDNTGLIWAGTNNGLNCLNNETKSITVYKKTSNPFSISNDIVNTIIQDKNGYLWIGTWDGLNRFDKKSGKFKTFTHAVGDPNSISSNRIFGLHQDKNGTIWVGTMGGGLNKFDSKTETFKYYTEKDGLPSNMVYSILEDELGNLWLSTNNGISKFNIATETFVNYDIQDGVQSSEFNQNAAYKTTDGEMFFGGMDGFNSFYPKNIIQNKFIPPVVITSFKIFNEIQPREPQNGDTIILPYYRNFLSFEFAALDFSNPYKNIYAYKLEKYDKDWVVCDANHRFAEYTKVNPGTYTFRVKGTNSDGLWNEKGISITIIVRYPWWERWWFRIPLILFIVLLGWILIYRRFRQLKKKHKIEKKMLDFEKELFELEQKALRLQMNPHFIFNSLNSIQSFIINNDTDKAIFYLSKFAQLMRLILSNSSQSFVAIQDEIKVISYYLDIEKIRFENKFEYKIDIDPAIEDEFFGIPPMIIQPYVENAIIHGILQKEGLGRINISLKLIENDRVFCVVEDNGIGREKASEIKKQSGIKHKSKGMLITKERLDILSFQNKAQMSVTIIDLTDDSGAPLGTRVELIIPIKEV